MVRPGRFDLKYHIGEPDYATRLRLVEIYTKDKKLEDGLDGAALAVSFDGLSCSAIEAVLNEASAIAVQQLRDIGPGYIGRRCKDRLKAGAQAKDEQAIASGKRYR